MFVGYTQQTYGGNLDGRSGAHAKCAAEYAGTHFCTDWEIDRSSPGPVATTAWIDRGNSDTDSRYFRVQYSKTDVYTCGGWTSSSPTVKPDGFAVGRGTVLTPQGGLESSFVSNTDGGCGVQRHLACCMGGTAVRLRGFTAPVTGDLGGRAGANAKCGAAFAGSRFCTDWEIDQAAVPAPIPATGAWVDRGNSQPSSRNHRIYYSKTDVYTCGGWTSGSASFKPDGFAVARATIVNVLGGLESTFVSNTDGGCQVARPIACCDGYPPE